MTDRTGPTGNDSAPEKAGIRLLADSVIDQIAAGEVVERPASVVKELVENSIDAGATRIAVTAREGGRAVLTVTDDGVGMSPSDASLALLRHATSKLTSAQDLEQIRSFGFRGEALPSIASVSRFRLITRPRGQTEAHEIQLEFGELVHERASGAPPGTRIEVADLFANVPARQKFLKRPATEWGHITTWLGRAALVHPQIHFEFQHDDRRKTVWPATSDRLERIAAVLSEDDAAALARSEREEGELRAELYVSVPERTRANAEGLHLFVNGRPVRDRLVRHALLEACRDWLPRGRFPTALLFLDVPPESVDVNVHPAKWEVRFSEPQAVHRLVRHSVRAALEERRWLGGPAANPAAAGSASAAGPGADARAGTPPPTTPRDSTPRSGFLPERAPAIGHTPESDWIFAEASPSSDVAGESERISFGRMRRIGQLMASYLLLEGPAGLVVVDQHAAHERILYERLRAQALGPGIDSQPLLWPVSLETDERVVAAVAERREIGLRLGFDVDVFGERELIVRAVPSLLADRDPKTLARDLAEGLGEVDDSSEVGDDATRLIPALDRIFATMACHSARRFGDHLPDEEQQAILDDLDTIPWAPTCPHGRPVAIALDRSELERRFGRH